MAEQITKKICAASAEGFLVGFPREPESLFTKPSNERLCVFLVTTGQIGERITGSISRVVF